MNKWIHRNLGAFRLPLIDYDCKLGRVERAKLLEIFVPIVFPMVFDV